MDHKVPPSMSVSLFNHFVKSRSPSILTVDQLYGDSSIDDVGINEAMFPCTLKNSTCFYHGYSRGKNNRGYRWEGNRTGRVGDNSLRNSGYYGCNDLIQYYRLPLSGHNDNHRSQQWAYAMLQFMKRVEQCEHSH